MRQLILFIGVVLAANIILYVNLVVFTRRFPKFTPKSYWKFAQSMGGYFQSHQRNWTKDGAFSEEEAKRIMYWQLVSQLEMFLGSLIIALALGSMLGL
jgi:hypothetical protein